MERMGLDQVKRSSSFIILLKTLLPHIFEKPDYSELRWDYRCQSLVAFEGTVGLPGNVFVIFFCELKRMAVASLLEKYGRSDPGWHCLCSYDFEEGEGGLVKFH